jgi:hypothetical protein
MAHATSLGGPSPWRPPLAMAPQRTPPMPCCDLTSQNKSQDTAGCGPANPNVWHLDNSFLNVI